jgi:hypothetical protein
MSEVVSFRSYRPPARFDSIPWTIARIEEAPSSSGPWTVIDNITLDPVDTNPAVPRFRSFTTELGTAPDQWYRVIFVDATVDFSEATDPVQNVPSSSTVGGLSAGGPCQAWTTVEDVLNCCGADLATDDDVITTAVLAASEVLYSLSGYQYPGVCEATVRPVGKACGCWVLNEPLCRSGCSPLSKVRLAGYPVVEITEVKIDGEVLDPSEYTLYDHRYLVRMEDADGRKQQWPGCQDLDRAEGDGTFFISYTYGVDPPVIAGLAARELACSIAQACPDANGQADCELPSGTVRVTRQGITIDTQSLGLWLIGRMSTGMQMVDAFISVHGGARPRRRTVIVTPENDPYPVRIA